MLWITASVTPMWKRKESTCQQRCAVTMGLSLKTNHLYFGGVWPGSKTPTWSIPHLVSVVREMLHVTVVSCQRLLPVIRPLTWLSSYSVAVCMVFLQRVFFYVTINIPKPKTVLGQTMRAFLCYETSQPKNVVFFSWTSCQPQRVNLLKPVSPGFEVLRGPELQFRRVSYLSAVRAWCGDVVLLSIFKSLKHLWQF